MSIKEQYWKYSLIVIILFMGIIIFRQITPFLGGLLGALTIYILVRTQMTHLTEKWKLKRSVAALLITAETVMVFLVPLGLTIWLLVNQLQDINLDPQTFIAPMQQVAEFIKEKTGYDVLGKDTLSFIVSILPRIARFNPDGGRGGYGRPQQRRTPDYDPNAKYSRKKQIEYKEQFTDPNEPIRLNKFLANAGVCSRREADEFITAGVVSVNGVVVTELGTKIKRADEVKFHDQMVSIERKIYILLNKPKDTVTTSDDPQARRTVMDLVKGACDERIYPVGRLDRNTTGVLLLTNDGDLASKLTHPKFLKKKIYHVHTDKNVTKADMDQIAAGIQLDDGEIHADAISYTDDVRRDEVGIEIHSGKNRIVRRIFESLGYKVVKLDRVFFAGLTKKGLRRGEWRYLSEQEVNYLRMGSFE